MSKKTLITAGIICCCAALCFFLLFFVIRSSQTLTVAFYEVPASVRTVLQNYIADIAKQENVNKRVVFKTLDVAKPLAPNGQEPKADIVFTVSGKNYEEAAAAARSFAAGTVNVTEPIKKTVRFDNTYKAVPLLADHFEAAYNKKILNELQVSVPTNTDAIEALAVRAKASVRWPIICAGGNDYFLSLFISAVTESFGGYSGWHNVVRAAQNGKLFKDILKVKISTKGETFADALAMIILWKNNSLLHPQWYDMTAKDVSAFLTSQSAFVIFMPLSLHRTFTAQDLLPYTESFFPGKRYLQDKTVTAPIYFGLIFSNEGSKKETASQIILRALASAEKQKELAKKTGLAPLHTTAQTPDRQASDVRFWTAASSKPIEGLAEAAYSQKSTQTKFLLDIRNYLKNSGKLDD